MADSSRNANSLVVENSQPESSATQRNPPEVSPPANDLTTAESLRTLREERAAILEGLHVRKLQQDITRLRRHAESDELLPDGLFDHITPNSTHTASTPESSVAGSHRTHNNTSIDDGGQHT